MSGFLARSVIGCHTTPFYQSPLPECYCCCWSWAGQPYSTVQQFLFNCNRMSGAQYLLYINCTIQGGGWLPVAQHQLKSNAQCLWQDLHIKMHAHTSRLIGLHPAKKNCVRGRFLGSEESTTDSGMDQWDWTHYYYYHHYHQHRDLL